MSKTISVTQDQLAVLVAQAVQAALAGKRADAKLAAKDGKSERSIENEIAVVKAFKKAGFGEVRPHEDVRTFNRWIAAGFRPREGSKSLKVKNLRLFHKTQVRPVTPEEKAAAEAQSKAAIARHETAGAAA